MSSSSSAPSRSSSQRELVGRADAAAAKQLATFSPVYGPVLAELEGTDALPRATDSGILHEILAPLAEESGESTGAILETYCNKLRAQAREDGDATAADSGAVFLAQARDLTAADGVFERALLRHARADVVVKPAWRKQDTFKRSLQNYYYIVNVSGYGRAFVWLVLRRTYSRRAANKEAPVRDLHAPPPVQAAAAAPAQAAAAAPVQAVAAAVPAQATAAALAPLTGAKRGRDELEPTGGDDRPRKKRAPLATAASPEPAPSTTRGAPLGRAAAGPATEKPAMQRRPAQLRIQGNYAAQPLILAGQGLEECDVFVSLPLQSLFVLSPQCNSQISPRTWPLIVLPISPQSTALSPIYGAQPCP